MPSSDDAKGEEGSWRLLNPLSIRFSQPRIAPHFRDGHLLTETIAEVEIESFPESDAKHPKGEIPPYDCIIAPPFPSIRVISFLPKIRRPDGEAERSDSGAQLLGQRAWFALDNRRLHVLQHAAASVWPKRCCAVVRCLEEVPGSTARELRKFRTTTEGKSVEIGARLDDTCVPWDWQSHVPCPADERELDVQPDGAFAEDLWEAKAWAPRALSVGSQTKEVARKRDKLQQNRKELQPQSQASKQEESRRLLEQLQAKSQSQDREEERIRQDQQQLHERQVAQLQQQLQQRRRLQEAEMLYQWQLQQANVYDPWGMADMFQPYPNLGASAGQLLRPRERNDSPRTKLDQCPETGWQYVDPSGNVQGPFALQKMRVWHQHGFFFPELPMRCSKLDAFVPFSELFPKPIEPFSGIVCRVTRE